MNQQQNHEMENGGSESGATAALKRPFVRKTAEWVTLGISTAIVLGLAGYLIVLMFYPRDPFVVVQVNPLVSQVEKTGSRYILPVEVRNEGMRTLRELKAELTFRPSRGEEQKYEFSMTYLPARATQKVYLFFSRDPRQGEVGAKPLEYLLD